MPSDPEAPSPAPAKRKGRKLAVDLTDTVVEKGQPLARVVRRNPETRTIEDVVRRHAPSEPTKEELTEQEEQEELETDSEEFPSIEDIAEETEIFTEAGPVPPPEADPQKRTKPTMGHVRPTPEGVDFTLDNKPKNLLDINAVFPIGDGNFFIHVDRVSPRHFGGVQIAGVQRPIKTSMTDEEFVLTYGGGEYRLIVYGPPKSGFKYDAEGKVIPKAMTEPVKYYVPGAPNPLSMHHDDEGSMFGQQRPGMATQADAKIHESNLAYKKALEESREQRRREKRAREEQEQAERKQQNDTVIGKLLDQQHQANQRLLELDREHRKELQEASSKGSGTEVLSHIAPLLAVLKPDGSGTDRQMSQLIESHRKEIEQMVQLHERDMSGARAQYERDTAANRSQYEAEMRRQEDRIRDITTRYEDRLRNEHENHTHRIRELEERSQRQLDDLRRQHERDLAEKERTCDQRIRDADRNHERDLKTHEATSTMQSKSNESTYQLQVAQKNDELARLRSEIDRLNAELERSKDLPKRLEEIKQSAALIGMSEEAQPGSDGPTDWKGVAVNVGQSLLTNLPNIVSSVSEGMKARNQITQQQIAEQRRMVRESMVQAPPGAGLQQMIPPPPRQRGGLPPMRFATEDTDFASIPPVSYAGPARMPGEYADAPPVPDTAHIVPAEREMQASPPITVDSTLQQPAPPAPPPIQAVMPGPPAPSSQQAQPTPAEDMILKGLPDIEKALDSGAPPTAIGHALTGQLVDGMGKELAQAHFGQVNLERLFQLIAADPRFQQSSFRRRDGKKSIREIFDVLRTNLA